MESTKSTSYKLIEGQEKQSLLDRYINQLSDLEQDNTGVEIFQISANLLESSQALASQRDNTISNYISSFIRSNFNNEDPAYTNNQDNISSLSELISKQKNNKLEHITGVST